MTAEDFFNKWNLEYYYESNNHNHLINIMKEFAELKCKELLEIVAEKVEIQKRYRLEGDKFPTIINLVDEEPSINKDSILNAVNLKEFIQ